MSYYKFEADDLFINTIEAYPDVKFYIQSGTVHINDKAIISGAYGDNITGVPAGYLSLYEYNINRHEENRIYPFVVKDGGKNAFKTTTSTQWNTSYNYDGAQIASSYVMSASISRYRIASVASTEYKRLTALRNTLDYYKYLSPHYDYTTYYSGSDTNMICIPSIFYGSSIKKGSVNLKFYISGSLAAQASDTRHNGELIQVSSSNYAPAGPVVGTILYNEGIILLTASADLDPTALKYRATTARSSWLHFGWGANDGNWPNHTENAATDTSLKNSCAIEFRGTNHIQTLTMLAKAPYGELNHSNNPTYIKKMPASLTKNFQTITSSHGFKEVNREVKNIVHANYTDIEPPFEKETYISKIALYDDNKNVIGFAKLATPVRKTEEREFVFKLKLDL